MWIDYAITNGQKFIGSDTHSGGYPYTTNWPTSSAMGTSRWATEEDAREYLKITLRAFPQYAGYRVVKIVENMEEI